MSDHAASVALPQATLNATVTVFMATHATRRGRPTLVSLFDFDPAFTRLVVDQVQQSLVRPIIQPFVAVATLIGFIYTAWVAHNERSYVVVSIPLNGIFRQGMQGVIFLLCEFVTRSLRLL